MGKRVALDEDGYRVDFWPYHAANPGIYTRFDQITHWLRRKGFQRASAYLVFERMRWETAVRARDVSAAYKLNNNFRPDYARLWMSRNPEFPHFLETRERKIPEADPAAEIDLLLS